MEKDPYIHPFNPKLVCYVLTSGTHIVAPLPSIHNRLSATRKKERFISCMKRNKTLEGNKKKFQKENESPQNVNEGGGGGY